MLNLLIKDFKLLFAREKSALRRFLNTLFSVVMTAIVVAIETFLFSAILMKIKVYNGAATTFICLFLAIISLMMIFNGVMKGQKLFFNQKDIEQLANHPVSDGMMISSKLIFLFLNHYATSFIFTFPIFAAYGVIFNKSAWFFFTALFYPLLSFLFEVGVALLLVYPVYILIEYLKKHVRLEFILAVSVLFALSFLYSRVLNAFVEMVSSNNINLIFTVDSLDTLGRITDRLVPISFLCDYFVEGIKMKLTPYVCISGGIFIMGVALTVFMFGYMRHITVNLKQKGGQIKYKSRSVVGALAVKELSLITKNPEFIFSFSGLLCVQPFLLYLIIMAMSTIFTSGTFMFYISLFPNFTSMISVFLVMMVTLIINSGANQYISMEASTIKNLKTIPVSHKTQLLVKMGIPFIMSEASMLISIAVAMIGRELSVLDGIFAFVLSSVALFVFDIISMREELLIRHNKPRSTFLSGLYAYLLPFIFLAIGLVLAFFRMPIWIIYLSGAGVFALLGIPVLISVLRNMGSWFMELETQY